MNNPLPLLWILLIGLFIGGSYFYHNLACEGCVNHGAAISEAAPAVEKFAHPLKIADGKFVADDIDDNLRFNRSGYEHLLPVSAGVSGAISKTADYLKANPNRTMNITGLYGENEVNNSGFSNLGMARANDVKTMLTNLGTDANQISIAGRLLGPDFNAEDIAYNAINYSFMDTPSKETTDDRLAAIEADLRASPIRLYFNTNQASVNLSAAERKRFDDLLYYLQAKPNAKITSTGHTDNVGNRASNIQLARSRAEFAAGYLGRQGVAASRITKDSKGPDAPLANNNTAAGKAKNRRVEISLQ